MSPLRLFAALVVMLVPISLHAGEPTVKQEDLPRIPATALKDAPATFQLRQGFQVQLVAGEPNVIDPIAISFDENGRMFVVEMRDYSERRDDKLGRIRMLEDTDGDGAFEKSTVFLKDLPWPTAVMCVNGGVLIGACPDIIFAKDTTGDGVADEQRVVFTGFGSKERLNVQGLFNNFQWGLDNRIHGCSGHVGGSVKQTLHPDIDPIDVRNKGFVINPRDWTMTTEAGGGQYGLSFDQRGRLFTCSNSVHIETFLYDARYAARNPYAKLPDPRLCIAADGPAAEVYRISPEEPWRVIRTRWRVAGLVSGPIEGGGRSAGYFTGATGVTIYKGDAFGRDYVGDAFIGDAGGNLVHHKRIRFGPDGIQPVAERPTDEKSIEFCASRDNWFRPVDFANTPDGSLFICDMYRETIEHPWSLPPQIKQFLDLNSGNDRGRIWRLAPTGFKPRWVPRLDQVPTEELILLLAHPNGWHRETASRLLYERQDKSAISLLEEMTTRSSPIGRLHALHALDGLSALSETVIVNAMHDADPIVRGHAVRLSEKLIKDGVVPTAVWERYSALADDKAPLVAYQVAFTLGDVKHDDLAKVLAKLALRDPKSLWMRTAVVSSASSVGAPLFESLIVSGDARQILSQLAEMIGAKGDAGEIDKTARTIAALTNADLCFALTLSLLEGADRVPGGPAVAQKALVDVLARATEQTGKWGDPVPQRAAAAALLRFSPDGAETLLELLDTKSETLELVALAGLDKLDSPELPPAVVSRWKALPPRVQNEAVTILLKRPARAVALIRAIDTGPLPATTLDASQIAFLQSHTDAPVRELAKRVLKPPPSRTQVIEQFQPALTLTGNADAGRKTYERLCVSCHRAAGEGNAVGPDLVSVRNGGREKLLFSILDPNREIAANYVSYLIETKSGESVLGILASDTPSAITVRQAYGKETIIPRADIKRMTSQGKSLMPEGLETGLKDQDVADLITFIETSK